MDEKKKIAVIGLGYIGLASSVLSSTTVVSEPEIKRDIPNKPTGGISPFVKWASTDYSKYDGTYVGKRNSKASKNKQAKSRAKAKKARKARRKNRKK